MNQSCRVLFEKLTTERGQHPKFTLGSPSAGKWVGAYTGEWGGGQHCNNLYLVFPRLLGNSPEGSARPKERGQAQGYPMTWGSATSWKMLTKAHVSRALPTHMRDKGTSFHPGALRSRMVKLSCLQRLFCCLPRTRHCRMKRILSVSAALPLRHAAASSWAALCIRPLERISPPPDTENEAGFPPPFPPPSFPHPSQASPSPSTQPCSQQHLQHEACSHHLCSPATPLDSKC